MCSFSAGQTLSRLFRHNSNWFGSRKFSKDSLNLTQSWANGSFGFSTTISGRMSRPDYWCMRNSLLQTKLWIARRDSRWHRNSNGHND